LKGYKAAPNVSFLRMQESFIKVKIIDSCKRDCVKNYDFVNLSEQSDREFRVTAKHIQAVFTGKCKYMDSSLRSE
jgi:hypothetical protein